MLPHDREYHLDPRPQLKQPRGNPKLPVTLIVGIIARDEIVFAADSQTSYGDGDWKKTGVNKIHTIPFKDGNAMLAECGNVENAENVIRHFRNAAALLPMGDYEGPANLLKASLRQQYSDMMQAHQLPSEGLKEMMLKGGLSCD